ncbi:hypothetical protein RB653_001384 [Dictyostelium firmibasis]|uniref:G-protein coupled receptors family 2 profile 2 domain-containing protein n=1 Tax=Dictyostelium firmibasis TaxID=79012 RepID=A0AAN7U3Y8_9MYCE
MGIEESQICNPTDHEFLSVDILNIVTSSLSLMGSALTIISYIWKKVRRDRIQKQQIQQQQQQIEKGGLLSSSITIGHGGSHYGGNGGGHSTYKQPTSKLPLLIFMLSIADFFTSFFIIISQSYLINSPNSYSNPYSPDLKIHFSPCIILRAIIQFFFLSTFFWTTCISYYLFHQLSSPGEEKYLLPIFNAVSWGIPFAISIVITMTNSIIVNSDGWCEVAKPMELSLWFLPLFLCLLVCSIYYFRLRRLFRSKFEYRLQINDRLKQLDATISRRLTLYIVVFVICWLPDVIQHFISFFSKCTFFPLLILQNILTPSQGFWNFWIYSYTNKIARFSNSNDENKRLLQ